MQSVLSSWSRDHPLATEGSVRYTARTPLDRVTVAYSANPLRGRVLICPFLRVVAVPTFWSDYLGAPWSLLAAGVTTAAFLFGFIGISTFFAIWAERKVSGRIQDRLGPTRVGPFGLLQSLADGIKLFSKEDFTPTGADRFLFKLAPYLAFCASFVGFLALPFGN